MTFKLFVDEEGKPGFAENGAPLFFQPGGSGPAPIDVNDLHDQVRKAGAEASAQRKEKEALREKLKTFDGLEAQAARAALERVAALDATTSHAKPDATAKTKAPAPQAVSVAAPQTPAGLEQALEETRAAGEAAVQAKERMIHDLLVKNAFNASAFLREKTVIPPDFAYAALSAHFSVEYPENPDGRPGEPVVIAKDERGEILRDKKNPNLPAGPEEAIRQLIERHPKRDELLKAPTPRGGSGSRPGSSAGAATCLADCASLAEKIAYLKSKGAV